MLCRCIDDKYKYNKNEIDRDVALLVSAFYGSRCVHLVNQWIVIFIHIVPINRLFGYVRRNSFLFLFFFVLFYFVFYLFNVIYLWTRGDGRLSISFFLSFFFPYLCTVTTFIPPWKDLPFTKLYLDFIHVCMCVP